ncbi:LysE family translocator [Glycomyces paridis]|uniref:LysE family translocator n=1 Tax=Glycomyces paridis TaxID=2126555 RepID=A0A4S8P8Y6_9ACTN|nr:LysE family translocator [Glycomyces paridis]THV24309.1 LysE family translocator [Glycomyces paridis]
MTLPLLFALAILIAAIVPGPDFAMVVRNTVLAGRSSGVWTAFGIGLGVCVWVVATSFGLAALLAASATAFTAVKFAGAAYLVYLGVKSLRAAIKERREPAAIELARDMSAWAAFRSGLMCNMLNPKAAVLFTALMPQFIDGGGPHGPLVLELAAVGMSVCFLWYLLLANLIELMRSLLDRPRVRAWLSGVTGAVMVAFGLRVAAT